jgi:hypothetical protein
MALKFQVEVFWVVMPCNVVIGYQILRGPCWLYFHHVYGGSMTGPLKHLYATKKLHGVTTQKTST